MSTRAEMEQDILNITMKIHHEFPELSKYIAEMPQSFSAKNNNRIGTDKFKEYYNSLQQIVVEYAKTHKAKRVENGSTGLIPDGYPTYPPSEDIYAQDYEEQNLNPEDISKSKPSNVKAGTTNEKIFEEDMSGDDLDIPGAELDDQQESEGSEDEENNYYSLGGDNHNNLEEDNS